MNRQTMQRVDIDAEISAHNKWRRQFLNAFAAGNYAEMPLSDHRGCVLGETLNTLRQSGATFEHLPGLLRAHLRFHSIANDVVELSQNGLRDDADLILPQLTDASYQLVAMLDRLRDWQAASE
jgi:hypothetical protein